MGKETMRPPAMLPKEKTDAKSVRKNATDSAVVIPAR